MAKIIGRTIEQKQLAQILDSEDAELLAIYGRRRIGKTFLIRNFFEKQLVFEISGIHNAALGKQLEIFGYAIGKATGLPISAPKNWIQAFNQLIAYLEPLVKSQKKVVFIDEFPWLHTPRSGFKEAFENFWNMWASNQKNLIVVVCGSAAAWMIKNIVKNKGGLHNRITRRIRLMPFNLSETESFLKSRKIKLDRYQMIQLYMVMGGVPQYLKMIEPDESAAMAVDRICFTKDGFLNDEFKNLFNSLFDGATHHMAVIKLLAKRGKGLSRNEIINACKLPSGGGTTQLLDELRESGFIEIYTPFGKSSKDSQYKLIDEYSIFYAKFIADGKLKGPGSWATYSSTPSYVSWSGIAYETICMKHIQQIKQALGILGVHTEHSLWRHTPQNKNESGVQLDLLIDRQDGCITICEMKFSRAEFEISKSYAKDLQKKLDVFQEKSNTKKTVFLTLVTTRGVKNLVNYKGLIQNEIKMDDLFQ